MPPSTLATCWRKHVARTSNMLPSTCCFQHVEGEKLLIPATCCRQQVEAMFNLLLLVEFNLLKARPHWQHVESNMLPVNMLKLSGNKLKLLSTCWRYEQHVAGFCQHVEVAFNMLKIRTTCCRFLATSWKPLPTEIRSWQHVEASWTRSTFGNMLKVRATSCRSCFPCGRVVACCSNMLNDLWAAILDFPLPVTSGSIHNTVIELLDPENVGIAVGAALLSSLEAEIKILPVYGPPSWISDFWIHLAVFPIGPSGFWIQKLWGRRWNGIAFYSLEAEI